MTIAPGSTCPADGSSLPAVTSSSVDAVREAVRRSRVAQEAWGALTFEQRAKTVLEFARALLDDAEAALDSLQRETGRSRTAARLPEVSLILEYTKGAVKVGRTALRPMKVALSPLDFPGKRGVVELVPRGVIGVIAPWNYPLMQLMKAMLPALLAGNGVVIKPSEHTPRTAMWLGAIADRVLPVGLVAVVPGDGATGAALIDAGIDAVVFTGSVATGKKVALAAAARLLPTSFELGGKDAAIVLADAAMDRTVAGVLYSALQNAGMDCAAIERVLVEETVADVFVGRLAAAAKKLRVGNGENAEVPPLQNEGQLRIVEDHVADAIANGAVLVCGGRRTGAGFGYEPTVLDRCRPGMRVVDDETFGPVVAVIRVANAEEAVRVANDSRYGLNGSVWTSDLRRGEALARRLEVGIAHVNGHAWTGTQPHVPWTGTKDTGPGVAGSVWAYATFARPRAVMVDKNKNPEPFWFPYDAQFDTFAIALQARSKGSLGALFTLLGVLGKRVKTAAGFVK
jgi:acyl-CoA reductase-like NAD-dependent aldehyde dehydrogenase